MPSWCPARSGPAPAHGAGRGGHAGRAAPSATSCSTGQTRSPPAISWPTSTCVARSRASSRAPSAPSGRSARPASTSCSPGASSVRPRQAKPSSASIVLSLRGARRSTSGRSPASGTWSRPPCRASSRSRSPWSTTAATCWPRARARAASLPATRRTTGSRSRTGCKAKIVQLLERSVGPGKVDAAVSADLDFDEIATTAETYDPAEPGRAQHPDHRGGERLSRNGATRTRSRVANNLPTERAQQQEPGQPASSERSNRTEETVNYEISRTVRNQTKRGGALRRLSIAVQVDGTQRTQPDGTVVLRAAQCRGAAAAGGPGAQRRRCRRGPRRRVEVVSRRFVQPDLAAEAEDTLLGTAA